MPDFRIWQGHGIRANLADPRAVCDSRFPFVALGSSNHHNLRDNDLPRVSSDNEAIGRVGFSHLWDQGYRSFAFSGIPRPVPTAGPRSAWSHLPSFPRRGFSIRHSIRFHFGF